MNPTEFIANLKETWARFSRNQKIGMGGAFCGVMLLIGGFAAFYATEDYVPVFDYIKDRTEAISVQNALKEKQIPVRTSDGGHVILVPRNMKEQAHLSLAESGKMPDSVLSYSEIMDSNSSFGLTDKELDLRINRAKEGALAKTIMSYRNIKHAKVHIGAAEKSLFAEDQEETRVSVLLTPKDALEQFSAEQVRTIRNLIVHSVVGLQAENISISDDKGRDLVELLQDKGKQLSHLELTSKKEKELRKRATKSLSEIYGQNNIDVQVSLELDFNIMEEESKELAPPVDGEEQGVKISEEMKETEHSTKDPKAIPGTTTNIPGYQQPEGTLSTSKSKESRVNYAYKSKEIKLKKATGTIKRMTVSVLINKEALPNKKLSEEIRNGTVQLVSNAIGLDQERRKDSISVQSFSFNKHIFEQRRQRSNMYDDFNTKLLSIGIIFAISAMLLFIFRTYRKKQIQQRERQLEIAQRSIAEREEAEEEVMTVEQRERHERERFLMEMARENPDELVKIIRSLMMDENYY